MKFLIKIYVLIQKLVCKIIGKDYQECIENGCC